METKAKASYLKISAYKLRLVADLIRGENAKQAEIDLRFVPKKGARELRKVLQNALNNAESRGDIDVSNLFIKSICINQGPSAKRFTPRARGMASPILKRTSHVDLVLEER
jgi:large subunit ribosomal protein L22